MRPLRILATLLLACAAGPAPAAPGGRARERIRSFRAVLESKKVS